MSISVLDSAGTPRTVETLPAVGQQTKAASLPVTLASDQEIALPTGASTEATLSAMSGKLPAALVGGKLSVTDPGALPLPTGASTSALQTTGNTKLDTIVTALADLLTELTAKTQPTDTQPVSAASLPLPTGAATQATLASLLTELQLKADLSETQPVSGPLTDAQLRATAVPVSGPVTDAQLRATAVPVSVSDANVTGQGSQTALNNNIVLASAGAGSYDATAFKSVTLQIIPAAGTVTAGAITFEGSNDNVNFQAVPMYDINSLTANPVTNYALAASTNRSFRGPLMFRYFRARISTGVTGTTTGVQCFSRFDAESYTHPQQTVVQATAANLNATVSGTVTAGTTTGNIAHGTAASGNPLQVALNARSTNVAAEVDNDVVRAIGDLNGRTVTMEGGVPQLTDPNRIALTTTTETTLIAAVASVRHCMQDIIIANRSTANDVQVDIRDTTTGTIRQTYYLAPKQTIALHLGSGWPQAAVNTNWTAQCTGTSPDVIICSRSHRTNY
jgi:hypothetical protein